MTAEFDSTTLRDAALAQTRLALVLTFTHDSLIGTGTPVPPVLQVYVPVIVLEGEAAQGQQGRRRDPEDPVHRARRTRGSADLRGLPHDRHHALTDG